MERTKRVLMLVVLSVFFVGGADCVYSAEAEESAFIIVAPARFRVVKLLHDVHRVRDVSVITCQGEVDDETPSMHELTGKGWASLNIAGYMDLLPSRSVILVGDDSSLPKIVLAASAQAEKLTRIETLDIATILSALKEPLKFSGSQVKKLAKRHGLTITDANRDARRWGRYGKPGTKKATETSGEAEKIAPVVVSDETMPPRKIEDTDGGEMPAEPKLAPVEDAFLKKLMIEKGDADDDPAAPEEKEEPVPEEVAADEADEPLPEDK